MVCDLPHNPQRVHFMIFGSACTYFSLVNCVGNMSDSPHCSDDKVVQIVWTVPGTATDESSSSSSARAKQLQQRVQRCVDLAISCANDFNNNFQTYNEEREKSIPQFHPDEIDLLQVEMPPTLSGDSASEGIIPVKVAGFYKEYILSNIRLLPETKNGVNDSSKSFHKAKKHFTKRSRNEYQYYSVKLLQDGIMETDHGPYATTEMIVETKILMNLSSTHPHIMNIYGITSSNISTLSSARLLDGSESYFFITDRISETLTERIEQWRQLNNNHLILPSTSNPMIDTQRQPPHITKRLEIALDVASALIFLHDRNIVYYLRPDKIGFDIRYGVVKLCYFGQCRQHHMESNPRSVTQSDNMSVLAYTAPEIFCMAPANTVADVYSFGVMLWEMISLQRPYHGYDRCQHFENVVRNHLRPLSMKKEDNLWDEDIAKLIKSCIRPFQRPTMKYVHATIETKLLYFNDNIIDTAESIHRRHSASLLQEVLRETKSQNSGRTMKRRQSSSVQQQLHQSSSDKLNSSALSLGSDCDLDEILKEVSDKLSGGTNHSDQKQRRETATRRNSINNKESTGRRTSINNMGHVSRRNSINNKESITRRNSINNNELSKSSHSTNNKELSKSSCHTGNRRSRDRVQARRSSRQNTVKVRRSRSSGRATDSTSEEDGDTTNIIEKIDRAKTDSGHEYDGIDDDEDLIASIMSQSEGTTIQDHQATKSDTPKQFPYKVTEVRKSLMGNRSPIRLRERRERSRSRSTSTTRSSRRSFQHTPKMLSDGTDESIAEASLTPSASSKPKLKLSPSQAVQNVSRKARYSSNPRSSRESQGSNESRPTLERADSDSTLGIRRKRRTSITEVKEKFDFVPSSPQKTNSNKKLQNVLVLVSPTRFKKEKHPTSPSNANFLKSSKNFLNVVLRRNSAKEDEPAAPVRRQMRRNSGSLVKDLVLEKSSSRLNYSDEE